MPNTLIQFLRHTMRFSLMFMFAVFIANGLSQESRLQVLWERDAFHEILLAGEPDSEAGALARYAFHVAQILYPPSGLVRPEDMPAPPMDADSFWHNAAPYVQGIALQRSYRFSEAAASFRQAIALIPDRSQLHARALQHLAQCEEVVNDPKVWAPLKPLVFQPAHGLDAADMMPQKWVNGRWVPIPETLRSRHDRKAGFTGQMFIHPMQTVAWFASDRLGRGDTDLFQVEVRPDGDFGAIMPAPAGLNTLFNERTPVWSDADASVYFSSDRTSAIGGFDVFVGALEGEFADVRRLPFAINSAFNESNYTPGNDGWSAWFVSDRLGAHGALYRIASESETRHPVHIHVQVEPDTPPASTQLTLWHVGSGRLLWSGKLSALEGHEPLAVVDDGANLLGLISHGEESAHTWFEWPVPVVDASSRLDFALTLSPAVEVIERQRLPAVGAAIDEWPVHWSLPFHAWSSEGIPLAPVTGSALPEAWESIAETACWQDASADARWTVVRAIEAASAPPAWPEEPTGAAWSCVEMGRSWTPEILSKFAERGELFNEVLLMPCEESGWDPVHALIHRVWLDELANFERALFWSKLSQALTPFSALHHASDHVDLEAHPWFSEAEQVMEQAIVDAYAAASWDPLIETREVWRDALFAHWQAMKERGEASELSMEQAYWELEQAFALPVWNNLESAAWTLLADKPNPEPSSEKSPVEPAFSPAWSAIWDNDRPASPPSLPIRVEAAPQVYTIQLGAFTESPDPTAFLSVGNGLSQINSSGWKKVIYGEFDNKDSARQFLQRIWDGGAFEGAFMLALAPDELEEATAWDVTKQVKGWTVVGKWEGTLEALRSVVGSDAVCWPKEEGTWAVSSPLLRTQRAAKALRSQWLPLIHDATIHAIGQLGAPQPVVHQTTSRYAQQATANESSTSAVEPVTEIPESNSLNTRWVIRVAEYGNGAATAVRAAMLRLPVEVRSVPWGLGEAFISEEIVGEEQALEMLHTIQAMGFAQARLLPVHVN